MWFMLNLDDLDPIMTTNDALILQIFVPRKSLVAGMDCTYDIVHRILGIEMVHGFEQGHHLNRGSALLVAEQLDCRFIE